MRQMKKKIQKSQGIYIQRKVFIKNFHPMKIIFLWRNFMRQNGLIDQTIQNF